MTNNSASAIDELIRFEAEGLVISYDLTKEGYYSLVVTTSEGDATDFKETNFAGDEDNAIITLVSKERDTQLIVIIGNTKPVSALLTTPVPAPAPGPFLESLSVEVTMTVEARVEYDAAAGVLTLVRPSACCDLDDSDEVLGRWDRDIVDSGALVRRLPLGQVVVEVDSTDRAVESSVRRMLALGKLVREDVPWGVYGGQRFRAVRVVTD